MGREASTLRLEPRSVYDPAIVGVINRCGQPPMIVYSYRRLQDALEASGMSEVEAVEHIECNVIGGWLGDGTPGVLVEGDFDAVDSELEGWEPSSKEDLEKRLGDLEKMVQFLIGALDEFYVDLKDLRDEARGERGSFW